MLDMVLGSPIEVCKNKGVLRNQKARIFEIGKKWGKHSNNNLGLNSPH